MSRSEAQYIFVFQQLAGKTKTAGPFVTKTLFTGALALTQIIKKKSVPSLFHPDDIKVESLPNRTHFQ